MNCDEIQKRLPEYLAGLCSDDEQNQVTIHIGSCDKCMEAMMNMQDSIHDKKTKQQQKEAAGYLHKARRKLLLRITIQVVAILLLVLYALPMLGLGIRAKGVWNINRAMVDTVQFSIPRTVNFYSNSGGNLLTYSMDFKVGTMDYVGTKAKTNMEYKRSMNLITGKIYSPNFLGADFIHPEITPSSEQYIKDYSVDRLKRNLGMNAQNTVASVNISLARIIQPEHIREILNNYDINIMWMAVETGFEDVTAQNASWGGTQVIQWGIPGKLLHTDQFGYTQLSKENIDDYFQDATKEMQWLNAHHHILSRDKGTKSHIGDAATTKQKTEYVLKNGFKIYGLQITGPTSEVLKLVENLNVRYGTINDIDFWHWK